MNYEIAKELYNIYKGIENCKEKPIIFVDCMDTIIKRDYSLSELLYVWSQKVGKEFNLFPSFLYNYRNNVVLSKMHNVVPIDYIYKELASQLSFYGMLPKGGEDSFCKSVHEIEIESEMSCHHIITTTVDYLRERKGKCKIYCISDFKMSSQDLKAFYSKLSIDDLFDDVFSSCDFGATKKEGSLYPLVLKKLGVEAKDCLMIGDNLMSDCINASKYGIQSCWIYKS